MSFQYGSLLEDLVPRIPDQLQSSVAYLYPDTEAARNGAPVGGTGFFVRRQHPLTDRSVQYLVTNTHVAQSAPRAFRINTTDGTGHFHEIGAHEWVSHPNGDDISAVVLPFQPGWTAAALDWSDLAITRPRMAELNMGVGDEVFMLGRFISHGTLQLNQPLARFGNVAMMPGQLVKDGRGVDVEAFLVEMRSLSGFSGSPVFVYMGPGTYRGNGTMMPFYSETIWLMGIDTGHKTLLAKVHQRNGEPEEKLVVYLNTGVSIVAPVWRIEELLDAMPS